MTAEQKFRLAKAVIIAMAIAITAVAIVWLAVTYNPSSMKAIINFSEQRVEIDCTFYNNEVNKETDTPCKQISLVYLSNQTKSMCHKTNEPYGTSLYIKK